MCPSVAVRGGRRPGEAGLVPPRWRANTSRIVTREIHKVLIRTLSMLNVPALVAIAAFATFAVTVTRRPTPPPKTGDA